MLIYLFFIVILCLVSMVQLFNKKNTKLLKSCWFIVCLGLILLSGLRYGLETDYWHYYEMFKGTNIVSTTEPAFVVLMRLTKVVTNNFNCFVLLVAIISIGIKCKIFAKCKYCFVVLLIYYLRYYILFELNAIRQGLAVTFVLIAIYKLINNDKKGYIVFSLIAVMFHVSSVVVLGAWFIGNKRCTIKEIIIMCGGAMGLRIFVVEKLLSMGGKYVSFVFNSSNNLINGTKYILYNNHVETVSVVGILRVLIPVICLYLLQTEEGSYSNNPKLNKYNLLFKLYLLGATINLLFLGYDTIGYRLASVFYCIEGLLVGFSLERKQLYSFNRVNIVNLLCYITLIACDLWSFIGLMNTSDSLIPYRSFIGM